MPQLSNSVGEITPALKLLLEPGAWHELRALNVHNGNGRWPVTVSGYFNDIGRMAEESVALNQCGGNVFLSLNPVFPELSARSENHTLERPERTTKDEEIRSRRWLFIDADPVRAAGIASTDEQHEAALDRVREIRRYLMEEWNWPAPVVMDSGNGAYLLFRIALDNDVQVTQLLERVLKALAQHFNDEKVTLDTTVFNASRIARVPGTVNRKGDSTPTRPHRRAALIDIPSELEPVSREQLEQVAAEARPADSSWSSTVSSELQAVLERLKQRGIAAADPSPYEDGFMRLLSACPFDSSHTGTSVAVFDYPNRNPPCWGLKCHHADCAVKKRKDVEKLLGIVKPKKQSAGGRQSQISLLVDIGMGSDLYHTPEGIPYARQAVDGHYEDWPTNSKAFREKLARDFHAKTGTGPGSQAVRDAIATLDGYARFEGDEYVVHVRCAGDDKCIWLDLGNQDREVVEITAAGWSVVADPPVRFRRPAGMLPLPVPEDGGSSSDIKSFLNVTSDADWSLILSWCVTALRPERPYPILYLLGEQGSAKSTATRVIRNLIDPFKAPLRTMPRDERDLFIAASNCRVLAFDNVSKLPSWLSDALCRLATGGGLATRALYTDCDEVLLDAMRPIVMNGIEQAAIRGDFLERAIMLELPTIVKADRRDEAGFWTQFKKSRPKTLGVVLDGVSAALGGSARSISNPNQEWRTLRFSQPQPKRAWDSRRALSRRLTKAIATLRWMKPSKPCRFLRM